MARKALAKGTIAAQNRRARFDYHIEQAFEAGIALTGTEVKSLRDGRASINEAYAGELDGALYLINSHIPEYRSGAFNHEPRRPRKLLMHQREIDKLLGAVKRGGMTLVPLAIRFNDRGMAKVDLALAKGKQRFDKRADIKDRDWQRQKARLIRAKG
jgi:SsrA-binding protein